MNGSLDYYKVFYTVAKYESMTKASEELLISQPAISKTIKMLETQIGGSLFNRSKKGITLNEEGKMLFNRIKPALELIENAEREFQEFKELDKGEINIGISAILTKCLLLDILATFQFKYPNIKINIINGLTSDLISKLNDGKIDFVIYNESDIKETSVNSTRLTSLRYVFFYNPLYFDVKNTKNLNDYPLILQNQNSNTRKYLDKYMSYELHPRMEIVSQDLICNLVNNGLGVGFGFEKIVDTFNSNLKKITVNSIPNCDVLLATNKNTIPSFAAKTFINELIKSYS